MASINNRVFRTVGSPLVLPKHHTCVLKPAAGMNLQITVDHLTMVHQDVKSIQYRVANEKVRFVRFRPFRSGNEFVTRLLQINRKGYIFEQIYIEMGYRAAEEGTLVREFLKTKGISKAALTDIKFHGGAIEVNGQHASVRHQLRAGEELRVFSSGGKK